MEISFWILRVYKGSQCGQTMDHDFYGQFSELLFFFNRLYCFHWCRYEQKLLNKFEILQNLWNLVETKNSRFFFDHLFCRTEIKYWNLKRKHNYRIVISSWKDYKRETTKKRINRSVNKQVKTRRPRGKLRKQTYRKTQTGWEGKKEDEEGEKRMRKKKICVPCGQVKREGEEAKRNLESDVKHSWR